jgi:hypothetical protein
MSVPHCLTGSATHPCLLFPEISLDVDADRDGVVEKNNPKKVAASQGRALHVALGPPQRGTHLPFIRKGLRSKAGSQTQHSDEQPRLPIGSATEQAPSLLPQPS